tara:strand:+ start:27 stop:1133 length:1107 start_codon:yes stop_codon:yes gene_type:complete
MVDATPGILTTLNTGSVDGGVGERVLIDYKEAIMDYKVAELPVMSFFAEPMTTDTGGNIDITLAKPSMKMEVINEGTTPEYQHTKLRSERVSVKEWGIAVGVTRRMIEDSRFNEVEMALNEARRAVDRHMTDHVVKVIFGAHAANADFGTIAIDETTSETNITTFSTNPQSGFYGSGMTAAQIDASTSRLDSYGNESDARLIRNSYVRAAGDAAGDLALSDITEAIDRVATRGYNASHLFISPAHYKSLLDLGDFVTAFTAAQGEAGAAANPTMSAMMPGSPVNQTASTGIVGSIYGLTVVVNAYVPSTRFGVFDLSSKPMVYVERRPLTVEEANPGFGIVGSYMSMRYGLKIIRPEVGIITINGASG